MKVYNNPKILTREKWDIIEVNGLTFYSMKYVDKKESHLFQ